MVMVEASVQLRYRVHHADTVRQHVGTDIPKARPSRGGRRGCWEELLAHTCGLAGERHTNRQIKCNGSHTCGLAGKRHTNRQIKCNGFACPGGWGRRMRFAKARLDRSNGAVRGMERREAGNTQNPFKSRELSSHNEADGILSLLTLSRGKLVGIFPIGRCFCCVPPLSHPSWARARWTPRRGARGCARPRTSWMPAACRVSHSSPRSFAVSKNTNRCQPKWSCACNKTSDARE